MTTSTLLPDLTTRLHQLAAGSTEPCLVSVELPQDALDRVLAGGLEAMRARATVSWERPAQDVQLFGFGRALTLQGDRNSPISAAAKVIRGYAKGARMADELARIARPRFFGGGRFATGEASHDGAWDALGGWQFTVPSLLIARKNGVTSGSLTLLLSEDSAAHAGRLAERAIDDALTSPSHGSVAATDDASDATRDEWLSMVDAALGEIGDGRYRKMVLARSSSVRRDGGFDTGEILSRLANRYRDCFVFSYRGDGATWLGASPELLCGVREGTIRAASLAGSKPRGIDEASDRRLAHDLFDSEKERSEHALVALAISEALAPLTESLDIPEAPSVVKMPNIQHLYTPISGRLCEGHDVLDVVTSLHPTPAVGGWPRAEALDAIERIERMDRGWYAGPIGWVDLAGDGDFAVGLRSALVGATEARLYAGAGIVAGSEPSQEYAETEAKFRPLREALGAPERG